MRALRAAGKKLKAFGSRVQGIGLRVAAAGAALAAPLVASAKYFSSYGDQVAKMAKRTGLSVETLSELRFVASQTGTEFESLEMAVRKMQRSIYDAGRGLSTQVDALKDLGLTAEDFRGLSPEKQFKLLADRISQVEDPTKKAAIAMTLFGRTGTNLLPMFEQGAAGIEALQKQARRLGLTMSAEDAKSAEDFTDAMDRLWKTVKMAGFNIGAALAPMLTKVVDLLTAGVIAVSKWIKTHRRIIVGVGKVIAVIVAAGVAIAGFGASLTVLGTIVGALASAISGAITVIGAIGAALVSLVSPIGVAIAAVVILGAAIVKASGAGAAAVDWLKSKFWSLYRDLSRAVGAIGDALVAGDLSVVGQFEFSRFL